MIKSDVPFSAHTKNTCSGLRSTWENVEMEWKKIVQLFVYYLSDRFVHNRLPRKTGVSFGDKIQWTEECAFMLYSNFCF